LFLFAIVAAQAQTVLTADQLQNGQAVELDKLGWKYSPNDEPRFADPQFDDSAWTTLASSAKPQDSPTGWRGLGWFRLHLRLAPELANVALNLEMAHLGASEVYVNGKLVEQFGAIGKTLADETAYNPNALPLGIVLQTGAEQVIAVRYSNQQAADVNSFLTWQILRAGENSLAPIALGFRSRVREFVAAASQGRIGYAGWPFPFGFMATVTTIFLSFGILHLLLFAFFAHRRSNLFYGLYLLGNGINYVLLFALLSGHDGLTGRGG